MADKLVLLVLLALSASACAPMPYAARRYPGPYAPVSPYGFRAPRAEVSTTASAVGRWDNVMLLPAGTPVQILMFDGRKAGGQVLSADATAVRVLGPSGEEALPMDEVMRVDRLPPSASEDYSRAAARGAAWGAGVVGVMGILVGHMPPARVFAGGAIAGAGAAMQGAEYMREAVMIYLAPPRETRR